MTKDTCSASAPTHCLLFTQQLVRHEPAVFVGRGVRVRGENYRLGSISPVANLDQLLQRDVWDRPACGRLICPIGSKGALNRALQALMVA